MTEDGERQVRGQRLVDKVLDVTLAELVRVDYEKMSFEQIAERAGVNRATLYRRWQTKRDLTRAALNKLLTEPPSPVDHGSLRSDLIAHTRIVADFLITPMARTFLRITFVPDGELNEIALALINERKNNDARIFNRAVERGELAATVDWPLLHDMLIGLLLNHVVLFQRNLDNALITKIVDMIIGVASLDCARGE